MGRPAPIVQDGMRAPRAALAAEGIKTGLYARFRARLADKVAAAREKRRGDVWGTVFTSRYSRHRIQLTAPRDIILADGTKIQGRPLVAQFVDSTYKLPKKLECQNPGCEKPNHPDEDAIEVVKRLRAHPNYGLGRDFWETADALDEGKLRKMATVAAALESDPDVKNAVLDFITEEEFGEAEKEPVREVGGAAPLPVKAAAVTEPIDTDTVFDEDGNPVDTSIPDPEFDEAAEPEADIESDIPEDAPKKVAQRSAPAKKTKKQKSPPSARR